VLFAALWGWLVPAAIALLAAGLELGGERWRLALRYDRGALEAGELWRLAGAHLVHLGPSHMLMNVAALAVLAYVFADVLRPRDWVVSALASALVIDFGLFVFHPQVVWYVGLSGMLHGFWAAGCIRALELGRREALPLLALIVLKLGYEMLIGPVPLTGEIAAGPVVTQAHAWGALGGALWPLGLLATRYRGRSL
jgi:rhomboid family GlyGly-CTERM serine protease